MDTLQLRAAIVEQVGRYCLAFDSGDADAWAGVFTTEGVFEVKLAGAPTPVFRATGTDQLRTFAAHAPKVIHHVTNLVFDELTSDSARTRATVLGTWASPNDNAPAIYTHGIYHQRWSLIAGQWLLAHQVFLARGYHPAAFKTQAP